MENGRRDSETSSPTRLQNPTSSRFLDSLQGMSYSHDSLGSEENKQIRLLYNELLPAAKNNIDSQLRTSEGKSWALEFEDTNYGGQKKRHETLNTENKEFLRLEK